MGRCDATHAWKVVERKAFPKVHLKATEALEGRPAVGAGVERDRKKEKLLVGSALEDNSESTGPCSQGGMQPHWLLRWHFPLPRWWAPVI